MAGGYGRSLATAGQSQGQTDCYANNRTSEHGIVILDLKMRSKGTGASAGEGTCTEKASPSIISPILFPTTAKNSKTMKRNCILLSKNLAMAFVLLISGL